MNITLNKKEKTAIIKAVINYGDYFHENGLYFDFDKKKYKKTKPSKDSYFEESILAYLEAGGAIYLREESEGGEIISTHYLKDLYFNLDNPPLDEIYSYSNMKYYHRDILGIIGFMDEYEDVCIGKQDYDRDSGYRVMEVLFYKPRKENKVNK
jgi:hypothetical protein